ncbi:MAG: hypothetical protein R3B13_08750 [Polyangiaceae bacterium]
MAAGRVSSTAGFAKCDEAQPVGGSVSALASPAVAGLEYSDLLRAPYSGGL